MRVQLPGGAVRTHTKHLSIEFPVWYVPGAPRQWQHLHQRSLIIDHHNKYNNHKMSELLLELLKCDTGSKCCWKNSTDRLAVHKVAQEL